MSVDDGLFGWTSEALAPLGTVTMRRMMGGATLYLDGTVFAILDDDQIWFKADQESDPAWDAEGCERFSMTFKDGRVGTMNYRSGPIDVYDDAEAMRHCARPALEAGLRAPKKRPKSSSRR